MSINRKLGDLANVLDDGTEGQVLSFNASGVIAASDIAAGASVYDSAALLPLSGLSAGDMAYVTGTNRFYISNGTGWYSVSLINTNPSITSVQDSAGGTTPFTLTTDGTATVITVTASDPEEVPLTYNYSVTSGSLTNGGGTTATVTQADNVFTVTPSTTEAYAGTFELTFTASDGINQGTSANSFTLQFITIVANSRYTTLLTTATGTSDNNNITDASTNNHSITVNGDTHAGTFSPYRSGGYSVHLDDGEEISFPDSSNYNLSNGSFSIEAWVYPTSYDSPWSGVISQFSSSSRGWGLAFSSTQITFLGSTNGGSSTNVNGSVTSSVPLNQWTHLLVTRDSNTIRIFNNGVLVNNFTESGTFNNSTNPLRIGELNSDASENFRGYVKDARVVKGSVPTEYQTSSTTNSTTIFSVPSEPLTAVTDTVLLSCHLPYISDGSTNNATPTLSGNVTTKPFSPYDYSEYDAADHGGSVYFDGTGDTLEIPHSTNVGAFGTNDFTVQMWYYTDVVGSQDYLIDFRQYGGNGDYLSIYKNGSNKIVVAEGGSNRITGTKNISVGQWFFITVHRDNGSLKLFVNGEQDGSTYSDSTNYVAGSSGNFIIGKNNGSASYLMEGYLSDIKVTHGSALGGTTVPTAPLSSSGASLHIKGTDASIIDKSQGTNLKLYGTTTGSTDEVRSGNWANTKTMKFDGNSDYLTFPHREELNFASNDWTIECWIYPKTNVGDCGIWHQSASGTDWNSIYLDGSFNPKFVFYNSSNNVEWAGTAASNTAPQNTWTHLALVRKFGTGVYLFAGGTLVASDTNDTSVTMLDKTYDHVIGYERFVGSGTYFDGYIQDFRITNGLARYIDSQNPTANFTPPTAPLEG